MGGGPGGAAARADFVASPPGAAVAAVAAKLIAALDVAAGKMRLRMALLRRAAAGWGAAAAVATATSGSADTSRSDGAAAAAAALDGRVFDLSTLFHACITPWALPRSAIAALLVAGAPTERSVVGAMWADLSDRLPVASGVDDREQLAGAGGPPPLQCGPSRPPPPLLRRRVRMGRRRGGSGAVFGMQRTFVQKTEADDHASGFYTAVGTRRVL